MDMKIEKYFYVHMKWSEMFNIVLPPEYFFCGCEWHLNRFGNDEYKSSNFYSI